MSRIASRRVVAVLVAATTVALSGATVGLAIALGQSPSAFLAGNEASQWIGGLMVGLTGAAVLAAGNRLGPALAVFGLLSAVTGTAQEYALLGHRQGWPGAAPAAWWAAWGWLPGLLGTLLAVPLLFPDGVLPSRRWRVPAAAASIAVILASALVATAQQPLDDSGFGWVENPLDLPGPDSAQLAVGLVLLTGCVAVSLAATIRILSRLPRLAGVARVQSALFAVAFLLALASFAVPWAVGSFALTVVSFGLLGIAIVRYQLFEVELYLPRAIAYAICVGATLAIYLVVTTATAPHAGHGYVAALVAAIAALISARLIDRLNRLIGRLLFGDRDRPVAALAALGTRLSAAVGPDEVLPLIVATVCESLRLPFAQLRLADEQATTVSAGHPTRRTATLPLTHAGTDVGVLTVGLRSGERTLAETDRQVLVRFAQQVSVATHGVRATRELRRSREQVVLARESERSRLHRDLHDGIGPALAGISLGLETAGRLVERDPAAAVTLIADLRAETTRCVDDVREVIAGLRPATLDEAGLIRALAQHAHQLGLQSGGRLRITIAAPEADAPSDLPPAVEVAAYRIITEALTNLARHSGATDGRVEVSYDSHLRLRVCDNGHGRVPTRVGTGLASMRERAEELGGTCTVTFGPGSGVEVAAALPLRDPVPVRPMVAEEVQ